MREAATLLDDEEAYARMARAVNPYGDGQASDCLLYTSDAADDLLCVDLGGRRIIKKKKHTKQLKMWKPTDDTKRTRQRRSSVCK